MTTARATISELLARGGGPLLLPGAGTPLEARFAAAAGFDAIYVSGYATAAWQLAKPDIGLSGLSELVSCVSAIRGATELPIVVDADTGYGDVSNVIETVRRLERAGASAIQIEDQTWPKRCGHLEGKTVEPAEVMLRKVRAALGARSSPDLFVIARTDARSPLGLDEAIRRARLYADAGADAVFIDAPQSLEEVEVIGSAIPGRLVVNMSESGLTPMIPAVDLDSWGYDIVLYPTGALRSAAAAIEHYFNHLKTHRDTRDLASEMMSLDDFNIVVGLDEYRAVFSDSGPASICCLDVAGTTAYATVRAVRVQAGDVVAVSAATGGVGTLVVQLLVQRGATVLGIASSTNADWLIAHGVTPIQYGEGLEDRLRSAAPDGINAFVDLFGPEYVRLATRLGVPTDRINTIVVSDAASKLGARMEGAAALTVDEAHDALRALADELAAGTLKMPIAGTYPLDRVVEAFEDLERRHSFGKIALRP